MANKFEVSTGKFGKHEGTKSKNVLMIHPPTVDDTALSPQEIEYHSCMSKVGNLMGDRPDEAPIGSLYIASYLRKKGISVTFIDLNVTDLTLRREQGRALTMKEIKDVLSTENPDIVAITSMTTQESMLVEIANQANSLFPNARIVAGGSHPSYQAEALLRKCKAIDVIGIGEGEKTMLELALDKPMEEILGIVFRDKKGKIIQTSPRPLLTPEELDNLPFPAYDLLSKEVFPIVPRVLSARGCVGSCPFCVPNLLFGNRIRSRNPARVVDEIEWLIDQFPIDTSSPDPDAPPFILIGDLTFGATPAAMLICEEIIRRKISVHWWCQTRAETINSHKINLDKMYQAGCRYIAIGLESASPEQLKYSNKGTTELKSKLACAKAKEAGLIVQGYFVIGLPGETIASASKTIKMIDELTGEKIVDLTHISMAVPYPGTDLFKNSGKNGYRLITDNFKDFKMGTGLCDGGVPPYEMQNLSRYQLYSLWQLALSVAAKNFRSRRNMVQ